jgi:hypothetical protein
MEYLVGVTLAAAVCTYAAAVGLDRQRAFYTTMVLVVATYYILFAAMAGTVTALIAESLVAIGFFAVAAVAFKRSSWLIVACLVGHGVFDGLHHLMVHNPGVPAWWPGFCGSFDVLAGAFLAMLLVWRSKVDSK